MRTIFSLFLVMILLCFLSIGSVIAGDQGNGGNSGCTINCPPPPCTVNCSMPGVIQGTISTASTAVITGFNFIYESPVTVSQWLGFKQLE